MCLASSCFTRSQQFSCTLISKFHWQVSVSVICVNVQLQLLTPLFENLALTFMWLLWNRWPGSQLHRWRLGEPRSPAADEACELYSTGSKGTSPETGADAQTVKPSGKTRGLRGREGRRHQAKARFLFSGKWGIGSLCEPSTILPGQKTASEGHVRCVCGWKCHSHSLICEWV